MRGPTKIWARSVQPFRRLLDTNKQTDKPNLYIDKTFWLAIDKIMILLLPDLYLVNYDIVFT